MLCSHLISLYLFLITNSQFFFNIKWAIRRDFKINIVEIIMQNKTQYYKYRK